MKPNNTENLFSLLLAIALLLLCSPSLRADGSATDDYGWSPDFRLRGVRGDVLALAHDGQNLYVGGDINLVAGVEVNRIARWDGAYFDDMDGGADMWIEDFVMVGDGTLYASGYFTEMGGVTVNRVARWDGDHWSALEGEFDGEVDSLAMVGDTLYVGGYFKSVGGLPSTGIAAWRDGPLNYPLYLPLMRR